MKLALPQAVRAQVEPGLPQGLDLVWYAGPPAAEAAVKNVEVAWLDLFDPPAQARAVEAGPQLKWVTTIQAGVNTWPLARMRERGLRMTNGAGVSAVPIAEFVVMGMLAMIKSFEGLIRIQADRRWAPWSLPGGELAGSKALIVGYGSIGGEIGRRLKAFGVEVVGVRRTPSSEADVIGPGDWKARLGAFDWVILAAAATEETRSMVGEAELAAMKPGARLVNVARGALVDQPALIAAARDGRLAGALLDVTDPEPPSPDDPIWTTPNILLTSHSAAVSDRWLARAAALFLDNLDRYRKGQPLRNRVDLELGY